VSGRHAQEDRSDRQQQKQEGNTRGERERCPEQAVYDAGLA
jgi:hypothetical protein